MKSWFSIENIATAPTAEISIFDSIGAWGITAKDFAAALAPIPKDRKIECKINSVGGSVFDGVAIYNMLNERRALLTTNVIGICASISSVIFCAGSTRKMASNSLAMIHDPMGFCDGDSKDMRETANLLDKIRDNITGVYASATGKTQDECKAAMEAETWMNAEDAKAFGLCTEITGAVAITNTFDLGRFRNGPKEIDPTNKEPAKVPIPQNTMTKTIAELASLRMVASAALTDEDAALQARASIEALQNRLSKAESDLKIANEAKQAALKAAAVTVINAAVSAGKIKDDAALKEKWANAYVANEEQTQAFIDNIEVATPTNGAGKQSHPPINIPNGDKKEELKGMDRFSAAFEKSNPGLINKAK